MKTSTIVLASLAGVVAVGGIALWSRGRKSLAVTDPKGAASAGFGTTIAEGVKTITAVRSAVDAIRAAVDPPSKTATVDDASNPDSTGVTQAGASGTGTAKQVLIRRRGLDLPETRADLATSGIYKP